jgi:hypothetical protein
VPDVLRKMWDVPELMNVSGHGRDYVIVAWIWAIVSYLGLGPFKFGMGIIQYVGSPGVV